MCTFEFLQRRIISLFGFHFKIKDGRHGGVKKVWVQWNSNSSVCDEQNKIKYDLSKNACKSILVTHT